MAYMSPSKPLARRLLLFGGRVYRCHPNASTRDYHVVSSGTGGSTQRQIRLHSTPNAKHRCVIRRRCGWFTCIFAWNRYEILSQGMNVKVCSFPEGEDPDSFAKSHSMEEIQAFFAENAKDFIQFKASLLMKEAADDPVKKAATIKDMVESISKIPDEFNEEEKGKSMCKAVLPSWKFQKKSSSALWHKTSWQPRKGTKKKSCYSSMQSGTTLASHG